MPKNDDKERYEVFEKRYPTFKAAAEKAVDFSLHSRESVAISCITRDHLDAYIIVTASLETP